MKSSENSPTPPPTELEAKIETIDQMFKEDPRNIQIAIDTMAYIRRNLPAINE